MKKTRETWVKCERAHSGVSLPGSQRSGCSTLIWQRPLASVCPLDLSSLCELKTKACHKPSNTAKNLVPGYKNNLLCCEGCLSILSFQPGAMFNPSAFSFHGRRAFHFNGPILTRFCVKKVNLKANKQSLLQVKLSRYNHFSFHQCKSPVLLVKIAPANLKARANFQHCTNAQKCVKSAGIWWN